LPTFRACPSVPEPMDAQLPPVPPRPDLSRDGPAPATWRDMDPGRMGAVAIVGAGLRIWAKNWFVWFLVALAMTGVITVLIAAVDPWTGTFGVQVWVEEPPFSRPDPTPLAVILSLALALFLGPWEIVVLTRSALRAAFLEPTTGRAIIGRTIRGVHSVLWIFVLFGICLIPIVLLLIAIAAAMGSSALVALIPLGLLLWAGPRLATVTHVFVGEDARGTRAIAGSWRLSRGAWGTSLGTLLLLLLVALAITLVPSIIVGVAFPSPVVGDAIPRAVIQALVNAITTPMSTAVIAALYLELRARMGVLDQQALQANLARFD
jgi:hypothetical protein